jgi:hypothetical protein
MIQPYRLIYRLCIGGLLLILSMFNAASYDSDPASELIGLWKATRYLGPDIRGTLTLTHSNGDWTADRSQDIGSNPSSFF